MLYTMTVVAAMLFFTSFALLLISISEKARQTFFTTDSASDYIERKFNNFDRKRWTVKGKDVTEDEYKAHICLCYHPSFLPTDDVRAWVEANRAGWNAQKDGAPEFWTKMKKRAQVLECAGLRDEGEDVESGGGGAT